MVQDFSEFFQRILEWSSWQRFQIVRSTPSASGSIFGLAEYLASLALLLVVLTISDFRYSYRLSLTKVNLRKLGFWVGLGVGAAILSTDVWFQNGLPVPKLISNPNNLKALFGFVFLTYVFRVIFVAIIRPPIFTKRNAKQFFDVNYHYIHQGNPDRLQILAEELLRSMPPIVAAVATMANPKKKRARNNLPQEQAYAHDFLLLIGDRRFCKAVVDKVPAFAFACFMEAQKFSTSRLPIFQFARNIGQEFISNTNSAFYQEGSGYDSGLVGYAKPVTTIVFGCYEFIEKCAEDGESPLDTDYREFHEFNRIQTEGYARASLAFLESYLLVTKGRPHPHSYALTRMLNSLESALTGVYQIDRVIDFSGMAAYEHLRVVVAFINRAVPLVDKYADRPKTFRMSGPGYANIHPDIYDSLAQLIFETIFAASAVSSPPWTAWSIQHNSVWSNVFGLHNSASNKIIALKVRRLLYDEIKRIDTFANFKGARILGYCLHVLGLRCVDRHTGFHKEFYPLQAAALQWARANFKKLLSDHPQVANACLQGSVSYDGDNHRLVQTYENATEKEPIYEFLDLD
jgi:hypothetical protein